MNNRTPSEQMAHDDLFFSVILICIGLYASHINWIESDWWGFTGTILLTLFGGFWLAARIYLMVNKEDR